jgi:hypothetical protein
MLVTHDTRAPACLRQQTLAASIILTFFYRPLSCPYHTTLGCQPDFDGRQSLPVPSVTRYHIDVSGRIFPSSRFIIRSDTDVDEAEIWYTWHRATLGCKPDFDGRHSPPEYVRVTSATRSHVDVSGHVFPSSPFHYKIIYRCR